MEDIKLKKQVNEIYENFSLIYDQYMDLYEQWIEKEVPKSAISRMMAFFAIDFFYNEYGKETTHEFFYSMIENHEDPNGLESNEFYN